MTGRATNRVLVIEIPFPTKADGSPWPDDAWIQYVVKGALNARNAFGVGSGAIFNDANILVRDD